MQSNGSGESNTNDVKLTGRFRKLVGRIRAPRVPPAAGDTTPVLSPEPPQEERELAFVLNGGGARGAYQAGVLRYIAEHLPSVRPSIVTGVSAGAINAAHLASYPDEFAGAVMELDYLWRTISTEKVFDSDNSLSRLWTYLRKYPGGGSKEETEHGFLDTEPLRQFLTTHLRTNEDGVIDGIDENIQRGWLTGLAVMTTSYSTGQSVAWIRGRDIESWKRPNRKGIQSPITIEHIMGSTSLPMFFPAIQIGDQWYGDGGIRLTSPLSPALHMGANRILAISTRYARSVGEADSPDVRGYPPAASVIGVLMSAVFLDMLEQDALTLERVNRLISEVNESRREGLRKVDVMVMRPSVDIAKMAAEYEAKIGGSFAMLTRTLGSRKTETPAWLSMLCFDQDYVARMIDIGYTDAADRADELERFLVEESVAKPA